MRHTSKPSDLRRAVLIWLIGGVIGAALIALPDTGSRLFSFSEAHGPSVIDALGALVMFAGWLVFLQAVWRRRHLVRQRARSPYSQLAVFTLGLGLGLLLASVAADFSYWWAIGAALLALVQLAVAYLARAAP